MRNVNHYWFHFVPVLAFFLSYVLMIGFASIERDIVQIVLLHGNVLRFRKRFFGVI